MDEIETLAADARQDRMDRIAVLYAEITAATREFLRTLAESDRHRDWAEAGFGSCADWLAWRIGVTRDPRPAGAGAPASEKVRTARALEDLPLISEAMAQGEISFSKVRALTRVATRESEAELLAYARASSTAGRKRLVRGWKTMNRADEQAVERVRHQSRCFSIFPDGEGMYVVRGRLTPETAAMLMRAVAAANDALFHASEDDTDRPEPEQLRADALGLLAERALAAGFSGEGAPISGSRAERCQVVLHVEPESLRAEGEPGMSEMEDGTRVSAETSRRLSCDAAVVEVVADGGGVTSAGRRTRSVPPAVRRALEARDQGCRFPGCGLRFTDAHHIEHWADGGETSLRNLVLLCRRHHRLVHEEAYRVFSDVDGRVVFFTPRGKAIAAAPPFASPAADPLDQLIRRNREGGVAPDWRTGRSEYRTEADVPIEATLAALKALDRGRVADPPAADAA